MAHHLCCSTSFRSGKGAGDLPLDSGFGQLWGTLALQNLGVSQDREEREVATGEGGERSLGQQALGLQTGEAVHLGPTSPVLG